MTQRNRIAACSRRSLHRSPVSNRGGIPAIQGSSRFIISEIRCRTITDERYPSAMSDGTHSPTRLAAALAQGTSFHMAIYGDRPVPAAIKHDSSGTEAGKKRKVGRRALCTAVVRSTGSAPWVSEMQMVIARPRLGSPMIPEWWPTLAGRFC